ncbi:MAG: glutamate-5-semialdehyde dehydrogenase [Bacillota bacterium]|nr:glutamate-5-semialdehyde dehydrogenase [Bacillota bacterium]HHU60932.1 glutamate-5-semialdehyde dehydrogenase [Natronincola sp.]
MFVEQVTNLGKQAKNVSADLAILGSDEKNNALLAIAKGLKDKTPEIIEANQKDMENGKQQGLSASFLERLFLDEQRILGMVEGLEELVTLEDPVGTVEKMVRRPNGLDIGQLRVPLGVVAIIYESRPNVTIEAAALCLKTGNAVILRGGSESIETNKILVDVIREALVNVGISADAVQLIASTEREAVQVLMKLSDYIDVLIPRGGAGLIKSVRDNSSIPVLETGMGNCHIYVDQDATIDAAVPIVLNAKVQRPSVCNAVETLLVHEDIATKFLPLVSEELLKNKVELRACERGLDLIPQAVPAKDEDWDTEYLDLILAIKVVSSFDEAVAHINQHGTSHSEVILTNDYNRSRAFLEQVDAAAVYINASSRFTDGFQFGLGAELGISTQKLHARGPMGLEALTTLKYIIYGDNQIRE